jgi:hypothetical protein
MHSRCIKHMKCPCLWCYDQILVTVTPEVLHISHYLYQPIFFSTTLFVTKIVYRLLIGNLALVTYDHMHCNTQHDNQRRNGNDNKPKLWQPWPSCRHKQRQHTWMWYIDYVKRTLTSGFSTTSLSTTKVSLIQGIIIDSLFISITHCSISDQGISVVINEVKF